MEYWRSAVEDLEISDGSGGTGPEREIIRKQVAIVTSTFYPDWYTGDLREVSDTDKVRGDLALRSLEEALGMGYQPVVVDGKSSDAFQQMLAPLGVNVVARKSEKRSPSRRQGFKSAAALDGIKAICWTEPEKVSFITGGLDLAARPIITDEADVVVPKRNEELFKETYPAYMYDSEIKGLQRYNSLLRREGFLRAEDEDLDLFFGPKIFKNTPAIVSLFMRGYEFTGNPSGLLQYVDPEELSDATFFPVVKALQDGLRVVSVEVPFRYPIEQRLNEDSSSEEIMRDFMNKRNKQRLGLLAEEILFIRKISGSKRPKLKEI